MHVNECYLIILATMNPQESLPSFFSITEDITEIIVSSESNGHISTKISKRRPCDHNYNSLLQIILMILQIVFQLVLLVVDYR
jgi:hypothetical protein